MTNYEMWKEDTKKLYMLKIDEMSIHDVAYEILLDTTSYDRCRWCDNKESCKFTDKKFRLDNTVHRELCLQGIKKHLEKEVGGRDGRE